MLITNNIISMKISSQAFKQGGQIPDTYTCKGENVIPDLQFSDIPANARSLTLIIDDPDSPAGTWDHFLMFNIQPFVTEISGQNMPKANYGKNDFNLLEYKGPCPPSGTHRYFFKLYALDSELNLKDGVNKAEIENAMQGHIIQQAELMGTASH